LRLHVGSADINPVLSGCASIQFADWRFRIQQRIGRIEKDRAESFRHAVILWTVELEWNHAMLRSRCPSLSMP
jgi:hypothetical protein